MNHNPGNTYMDYKSAAEHLSSMLSGRKKPLTARAVKEWDIKKKLPFFTSPDGRRRIQQAELEACFQRSQIAASNASR
jgi:hypothetical protein